MTERAVTDGPVGPAPEALGHLRVRFAKVGKVRWTSHRDVARMWERALRRAGLPVAYSGGFSPHPLLSFGLALPTGCESVAEYVDVALDPAASVDDVVAWSATVAADLASSLAGGLPEGMAVMAATGLLPGEPSLQQAVTACTWEIPVPRPADEVTRQVTAALAAAELPVVRERKGRSQTEDLRPSLLAVDVIDDGHGAAVLHAETATRPRGVRPSELADALELPLGTARRTHQWIDRDGSRQEPIVAGLVPTPQAVGCPS